MITQLAIGGGLIGLNVIIHAFALDIILRTASKWHHSLKQRLARLWKPFLSSAVVLAVFCSHIAQIWIWALVYLLLKQIPLNDIHTAVYFSTTTMTTLGFGDITLPAPWNLLSAIEAANGFIIFGWSTAFIFEVMSQIYRGEVRSL